MKKIIIPAVIAVALGVYVVFSHPSPESVTGTPTPTGTSTSAKYRDGIYTGPVTDAFYGNMQVRATIKGGKLTDIEFLQYPNSPGNTTAVSNRSLPILKAEAIQAQSANIDMVSGATQTVEAFQKSLAAALAQAQ